MPVLVIVKKRTCIFMENKLTPTEIESLRIAIAEINL